MCQSYSSMMFSISRASCWMEAPNWKNVDFTSWEKRTGERNGGKKKGEDRKIKGGGEDIELNIYLDFCLTSLISPPANSNCISEISINNRAYKLWHNVSTQTLTHTHIHTHTHTYIQLESNKLLVEEIYGWGAQNNSIKPKLDWCGTGRLQNSVGLVLGNEGYIHSESHISTPLNLTQNHLPFNSAKLRQGLGQSRQALLQVDKLTLFIYVGGFVLNDFGMVWAIKCDEMSQNKL